jgi:hypothetical protein
LRRKDKGKERGKEGVVCLVLPRAGEGAKER